MASRRKTFVQINDSKKVEIWFPSPYDQVWELEGLEELISDGFTAHGGLVNHFDDIDLFSGNLQAVSCYHDQECDDVPR